MPSSNLVINPAEDADEAGIVALWERPAMAQALYETLDFDEQVRIVYAKWLAGREPTP